MLVILLYSKNIIRRDLKLVFIVSINTRPTP